MERLESQNEQREFILTRFWHAAGAGNLFKNSRTRKKAGYVFAGLAALLAVPAVAFGLSSSSDGGHGSSSSSAGSWSINSSDVTVHSDSSAETEVIINGEVVPVPPDGSIHKKIETGNGQTSVDVNVQNNSSSSSVTSESNISTHVEIRSDSSSR